MIGEIPTQIQQNLSKNQWKEFKNNEFLENFKFAKKLRKSLTIFFWNIEVWAVQKHVNLVDLVKSFPTNILLQNLASIQKRTSPIKFAHLAEKSGKGSISNLSSKERTSSVGEMVCENHRQRWQWTAQTWAICTRRAGKLYKARSRLYRSQSLQVNTRWKALDEIYKIYVLLHRSGLNISENFRQTFSHFSAKFSKNSLFLNSFHWFLLRFSWNFVGISPIF